MATKQNFTLYADVLRAHKEELFATYHVKRIGIFGSAARGSQREESDIDVLVEFFKPVGMFEFLALESFLSKLLGRKVDLVTEAALKPAMKDGILNELVYV